MKPQTTRRRTPHHGGLAVAVRMDLKAKLWHVKRVDLRLFKV
jgi:hypothetical protein